VVHLSNGLLQSAAALSPLLVFSPTKNKKTAALRRMVAGYYCKSMLVKTPTLAELEKIKTQSDGDRQAALFRLCWCFHQQRIRRLRCCGEWLPVIVANKCW